MYKLYFVVSGGNICEGKLIYVLSDNWIYGTECIVLKICDNRTKYNGCTLYYNICILYYNVRTTVLRNQTMSCVETGLFCSILS